MLYREKPKISNIIQELQEIRWSWKLNLGDVAHRAGLGRNTLTNSESGHHSPNLETLEKWADALGYEIVLKAK